MPSRGRHSGEIAAGIGLASLAGIAGGTYKFAEFLTKAKRLHDVASENAVFVRIADNVRDDLREVERLLGVREVKEGLRAAGSRARLGWVEETMKRVRGVLEDMDKYTGRVEGDVEKRKGRWWTLGLGFGSGVGWRHRLRWVLDEHEKLDNRTLELSLVHQSLLEVMSFLAQFEAPASGGTRDQRRVQFDVRREYIDGGHDEHEREVRVWTDREKDFVEGRRIQMVDNDPGYGYGGGEGPRMGSNIQYVRREYDLDEGDDRMVYKTKRVYEYDEPRHEDHHHGHWVRKKVHVHHGRDGERDTEVVRVEHPGHRGDHESDHKTEVYRERREYDTDGGSLRLRTHWPSSRL